MIKRTQVCKIILLLIFCCIIEFQTTKVSNLVFAETQLSKERKKIDVYNLRGKQIGGGILEKNPQTCNWITIQNVDEDWVAGGPVDNAGSFLLIDNSAQRVIAQGQIRGRHIDFFDTRGNKIGYAKIRK